MAGETIEDRLMRPLSDVEGWLHLDEAAALYRGVQALPLERDPLILVEIGSWKGRSSITMATALRDAGRRGTVHAIDPHTGNVEHHERWGSVDTFDEFVANVERAGASDLVAPIRGYAHDVVDRFEDGTVDLLFIDGSHEYEDVRTDLDDWVPKLAAPAVVGLNDTSWPGVYKAIRQRVLCDDAPFRDPLLVRSTLYLWFDPTHRFGDDRRVRQIRSTVAARRAGHPFKNVLPAPVKVLANQATRVRSRG